MATRWGLAVGMTGIYFVGSDGIYQTTGGAATLISSAIEPIFQGVTRHGIPPINFSAADQLDNGKQWLIYSLLTQKWRHYSFQDPISMIYSESGRGEGTRLLLGSNNTGLAYTHEGMADGLDAGDPRPIPVTVQSAYWDAGQPRVEKSFGDVSVSLDRQETRVDLKTYVNNGSIVMRAATSTSSIRSPRGTSHPRPAVGSASPCVARTSPSNSSGPRRPTGRSSTTGARHSSSSPSPRPCG
jgi:hypothetical protein